MLKQQGAIIVDPADIPSVVDQDPSKNFLRWHGLLAAPTDAKGKDADCSVVFKYGMKRDFNTWLAIARARGAGEVADRAARLEPRARARPARSNTASRSSTSRTRWTRSATARATRPTARRTSRSPAAHGIDEVMKRRTARRAAVSRRHRRGDRRAAGLSDGHRAVRHGAERADAAVPGRLRRQARAVRRQLHRHGVQRAASDRARLRVRAGDEAARAAGVGALI